MTTHPGLEQRLTAARGRLSERRRRLIHAILDSAVENAFLSSRELARLYEVDPATIVRTVQALGYRRFADFSTDLRAYFLQRHAPYFLKTASEDRKAPASRVSGAVEQDLGNVQRFARGTTPDALIDLARRIRAARRTLVVGIDAAHCLASYLAFKLRVLGIDATAPAGSEGDLLYRVRLLAPRDFLVAISFGRCLKQTILAAQRAHQRGVPTFGITDSHVTPIAEHCDGHLVVDVRNHFASGSFAAAMALLSAVVAACVSIDPGAAFSEPYDGEPPYLSERWYTAK